MRHLPPTNLNLRLRGESGNISSGTDLPKGGDFPRQDSFIALLHSLFRALRIATVATMTNIGIGNLAAADAPARPVLALCGDSITAGRLYSVYIENYLLMCTPQKEMDAVQFGWGGETAAGFEKRQETSCLVFRPSAATICYGMNDGGYEPADQKRLETYSKALTTIVERFKKSGTRHIVVGSPGAVDPEYCKRFDATMYNQTLAEFTERAKQVAQDQEVVFANIHHAMKEAMKRSKEKYGEGYAFGGTFDGVHPSPAGHLVMAYVFLKALGFDAEIGTFTLDLQAGQASASEGHRVLSFVDGVAEIESDRYPFCFSGKLEEPSTASMIQFIPFNEELNRLRLVVKNAGAKRLRISWGSHSRVYSAEELEKGINLAAEFLENPFSEPFHKVENIVEEKQGFEIKTKELFGALDEFRKLVPDDRLRDLQLAILAKDLEWRNRTRSAVVPVKHQIRVEAE